MSLRLKSGNYNVIWPVYILKYSLSFISSTFFGHTLALLLSIFKCLTGTIYYSSKAPCTINDLFYLNAPLSVIVIIMQIILSLLTISMYYNADFIVEGNDLLKKRSSIPDIIFLICKIIIIAIFGFDNERENEHWGILFLLCLTTGINVYGNFFLQNYENIIIKKFNDFYCLFLFWGFFCLFISNIFKNWNFGGGFYLFIIGLILIIIYCLFYSKTYKEILHLNFNEMKTSQECLNYIKEYLNLIKRKEESRDTSMILTSFIEKAEDKCINKNCVLKKYLESLSKGFDSNYLLLQYAHKLFKIALKKFSRDITLKMHYIIFLLTKVNQKKNAQRELFSIKSNVVLFDINFKIYRCKRYIEEYNSISNLEREEGIESNDIFQEFEYKKNCNEFRRLLSKSSSLYYDFWSSLYNSHLQGTEDFKKLNDIGAELNELIEKIENTFEKLCEIKNNDLTIIKLYESYSRNILNDKEKYEKYNNISMNLISDNKVENREKDYSNFDLKIISESDEHYYLIISASEENKGTIINLSLNTCLILGYHKQELIGKSMNILIPEIYHKIHNKIFNETTEKTKTEFFENLSNKITYTPTFLEISSFCKNKSKYLFPFDSKVFFVQTEDSELVYVVDITRKEKYNNDLYEEDQLYCVLTDNNLIIQTFTSNCVELLGLNPNIINSNYDISSYIKEYNDNLKPVKTLNSKELLNELKISNDNPLKDINNINDKSMEKLKLKKKLLKMDYKYPRKIIWKINNPVNISKISENKIDFEATQKSTILSSRGNKTTKISDINETKKLRKILLLEVKEAFISGKLIGYYFYFNNIKLNENNNNKWKVNEENNKSIQRRLSAKYFGFEEGQSNTSRINNKEKDNSVINQVNFNKIYIEPKKENSMIYLDVDNIGNKNENNTKGNIIIGGNYIPKCKCNFYLDIETMSYKLSPEINTCQELYNLLRSQSMEKVNIMYKNKNKDKDKKTNSSFISNTENSSKEYDSNSSEDKSSSISSSESISSNDRKLNILNKNTKSKIKNNQTGKSLLSNKTSKNNTINKNNKKNGNDEYDDEYYQVNTDNIILMIYDFNQQMLINHSKNEKKSQIEIIMENYKSKQFVNLNKDPKYPNINFEKYVKETKDKKNKNNVKTILKENNENINKSSKEKDFEKEISYALSKKDEQKSIIYFYKISFLFLIVILLMNIFEMCFIIYQYLKLKENMTLVIYATNLKYFTNFGIYYIREKILYNIFNNITDGIYDFPDENPYNYEFLLDNLAKEAFTDSNSILELIIGTSFNFKKDTVYTLTEKPFDIEILYSNNDKIKNVTTNFYSLIIQVYSSFCNILINFNSLFVDDPNVYNFIHNSFNNLGDGLNTQLQLFVKEIKSREWSIIINIIIYSCIYLILHIVLYYIINKSYSSIVIRKASYIEVFYGIGLSLIKASIKKCEIFINMINQNNENTKTNDIDEETSSFISSYNLNNILENDLNNNKKQKKKRKIGDDKKSTQFKFITKYSLILSFLYLVIVFCTYLFLTKKFVKSGTYILYMQSYHNNIIELFNSFREYLFDENTIIYGLPVYEYLLKKEEDFYSSNTEAINYLTILSRDISGLYSSYLTLQEIGFCGHYITYFKNTEECEVFLGGKGGIINLGFHTLINSFIEEIRIARNDMKSLLDKNILVGNLSVFTDTNFNDTSLGLDKNETLKFRMIVFNLESLNSRLNIIFLNIILQYIDKERNLTIYAIDNFVTSGHILYVIILIIYIILFLILFIFYWIPNIRRMNIEIYKTKNMLSIIPVQILAAQPDINELLNISSKND